MISLRCRAHWRTWHEAARATELEMGSLPLDIVPLLEETFEFSSDEDMLAS